jgi:hypothetical protein
MKIARIFPSALKTFHHLTTELSVPTIPEPEISAIFSPVSSQTFKYSHTQTLPPWKMHDVKLIVEKD